MQEKISKDVHVSIINEANAKPNLTKLYAIEQSHLVAVNPLTDDMQIDESYNLHKCNYVAIRTLGNTKAIRILSKAEFDGLHEHHCIKVCGTERYALHADDYKASCLSLGECICAMQQCPRLFAVCRSWDIPDNEPGRYLHINDAGRLEFTNVCMDKMTRQVTADDLLFTDDWYIIDLMSMYNDEGCCCGDETEDDSDI